MRCHPIRRINIDHENLQALNTVLAFFSSRKSLAVTFTLVRKSVENLLKRYVLLYLHNGHRLMTSRPLDLEQVAQLK